MRIVVPSKDAMEFFEHRVGRWRSQRVTHHLAFRRAENGESVITMKVLKPEDERIIELCKLHKVDPTEASGGCHVSWEATMAWDQEGENHTGETIFAIVPDIDNKRKGRMLRDRGYAEIVPVAGRYEMTEDDELSLSTPYEGGAVEETFSFDHINVCNRVSSVKRFGGIATATFSTETRLDVEPDEDDIDITPEQLDEIMRKYSIFGAHSNSSDESQEPLESNFLQASRARFAQAAAARQNSGAPSANSAFGSGFTSSPSANGAFSGNNMEKSAETTSGEENSTVTTDDEENGVDKAARKAGIDLSKVPPSMRAEFIASLEKESK